MRTRDGDEQGPLGVVLALDVDEVFFHVGVLGEEFVEIDGLGVHVDLPGEEADGLGEAADRIDIQSLDDGGPAALAVGTSSPARASETAWRAMARIPLMGRVSPVRASSPTMA